MDANTYILQFVLVYLSSKITGISGSMVYTFSLTRTTWNQAQEHCESIGSRLVTLTDETAYDEFTDAYEEMLKTYYKTYTYNKDIWIGLYDKTPPSGSYRWTDCSSMTFSKWQSGEPNSLNTERCVRLSTSYEFKTRQCHYNYLFACESPVCSEEETGKVLVIQPLFLLEPERQSSDHKCDSPVELCPESVNVLSSSTTYNTYTTSTTYATSSEKETSETTTTSALEAPLDTFWSSEHPTSSEDIRTSSTTMVYSSTTSELTVFPISSTFSSDIEQAMSTREDDSSPATSTGHDLQTSGIVATVTDNSAASSTTLKHTTPPSTTTVTTPEQRDHNPKITEKCTCVCKNTAEDRSNRLIDIKKKLTVNATTLSSYRRKFTSAEDNRKSATVSGFLGIVVIVVMVTVFLIADIQRLCVWAKSLKK